MKDDKSYIYVCIDKWIMYVYGVVGCKPSPTTICQCYKISSILCQKNDYGTDWNFKNGQTLKALTTRTKSWSLPPYENRACFLPYVIITWWIAYLFIAQLIHRKSIGVLLCRTNLLTRRRANLSSNIYDKLI